MDNIPPRLSAIRTKKVTWTSAMPHRPFSGPEICITFPRHETSEQVVCASDLLRHRPDLSPRLEGQEPWHFPARPLTPHGLREGFMAWIFILWTFGILSGRLMTFPVFLFSASCPSATRFPSLVFCPVLPLHHTFHNITRFVISIDKHPAEHRLLSLVLEAVPVQNEGIAWPIFIQCLLFEVIKIQTNKVTPIVTDTQHYVSNENHTYAHRYS